MSQEKKWYLFIGPHHIGPFDRDQVVNLYKKNEISPETMVFCQGMSEWRPLNVLPEWREQLIFDLDEKEAPLKRELAKNIAEGISSQVKDEKLKEIMDVPSLESIPNIPPAAKPPSAYFQGKEIAKSYQNQPPVAKKKFLTKKNLPKIEEENVDEYPSHETPPPFIQERESAPEIVINENSDQDIKVTENKSRAPSFTRYFFKGLLIMSLLTGIAAVAVFIILSPKEDQKAQELLSKLAPTQKAKLLLVTRENSLPFLKVGLEYISDEKNKSPQFLMAFNRQGPFQISATLNSLPKKILSLTPISLQTATSSGLHLAHFKKWAMVKGQEFSPGFYALDLKMNATGMTNQLLEKIQAWGILNFVPVIRDYKSIYSYHGLFWLGVADEKSFEQNLGQYYRKLLEEKSRPLQETLEQWKTINMILEDLKSTFLTSLRQMKSGKEYMIYERLYSKKVAPPLQQLMMMYIKDKNQSSPLFIVAKDIGKLGADMSDLLHSKTKFNPQIKKDLEKTFHENWALSFNSSVSQITKIEKELQAISEEYSLE